VQLKKLQSDTIDDHTRNISEFTSIELQAINSLGTSSEKELAEMKNLIEQEGIDLELRNRQRVDELRSSLQMQRDESLLSLSANHSKSVSSIETEGYSKHEYKEQLAGFQATLEKCQQDLARIQAPKLDDNSKYQAMNAEVDRLKADKHRHENQQRMQRKQIEDKWNSQFQAESNRHFQALPAPTSGRNREQVRLALQKQIEEVKSRTDFEAKKTRELANAEEERFAASMEGLARQRNELQDGSDMSPWRDRLPNLQNELQKKVSDALNRKAADIQNAASGNRQLQQEVDEQIVKSMKNIDELKLEFAEAKKRLGENLPRIQDSLDANTLELKDIGNQQLAFATDSHRLQRKELEEMISNCRSDLEDSDRQHIKQMSDAASSQKSSIELYLRTIHENIEKQKADWVGLRSYLAERIDVMTNNRDAMMNRYQTWDGRECDRQRIENLEERLEMAHSILRGKITDLVQYRRLMVSREKIYNSLFGRSPSVGTLQFATELRAGPRSARS
jgi:hypothetical protein